MVLCSVCHTEEAEQDKEKCTNCENSESDKENGKEKDLRARVNDLKYIPCELLCYAVRYADSSSPESLIKVISTAFNDKEILAAKDLLWNIYGDHLEKPRRSTRKTATATATETDVDDLVRIGVVPLADKNMFIRSDVRFCALDPERLPKYNPEETNMHSVMADLNKMQSRLKAMEETVFKNCNSIDDINKVLGSTVTARGQPQGGLYAGPGMEPSKEYTLSKSLYRDAATFRPLDHDEDFPLAGASAAASVRDKPSTPYMMSRPDLSIANRGNVSPSRQQSLNLPPPLWRNERPQSQNMDLYSEKAKANSLQEARRLKREAMQEKAKSMNVITGKRSSDSLSGAEASRTIFVFNVDKNWSDTSISDEMKSHNVTPMGIRCVSHSEAQTKSFRVIIKEADYDKVMCEDFWPERIKCRDWVKF